ncbi:MAG: 3-dehydroquinate synthase [Oscillospiraceae bacterium]|jgi:3-dehydroquinate synthase/3-phosphoshikimate 1-carboxyvinyltransferase|nr:3-dehydroquinate synthase [Oscillospiraceae bacterium]
MQVIKVNLPGREYEVTLGVGAFELLPRAIRGRRAFVVTDSNVSTIYGERLAALLDGASNHVEIVAPGESSKTIEQASKLWSAMQRFGLRRGDVVVAFGGGVVGDLAGFAASAYMRGVSYIQIPTTLVAQVDSSVGGKTAVNLPEGKNLIGAFHQPEAVLLDVGFLETLPERELKAGLAECVKYAMICAEPAPPLDNYALLTAYCVTAKARFVELDELDFGARMYLNFGHTFAHAIEKRFDYRRYNHGEAVAIGMALALHAGAKLGVTPTHVRDAGLKLLTDAGLDIALDFDPRELVPLMQSDKKNGAGTLKLVLLRDLGDPVVVPIAKLTGRPSGRVAPPPSKSVSHRRVICSALAGVRDFSAYTNLSDDIDATVRCISALVNSVGDGSAESATPDCGESGTTLRFLVPIAAALGRTARFTGHGRLLTRPIAPLLEALSSHGASCTLTDGALTVSGQLCGGTFELPGDVSSQFVSGLLLAAPLIGGATVRITSALQSASYVDVTIGVMREFGVEIRTIENGYIVPDSRYIAPQSLVQDLDWSQAAFFLAARALGCDVEVTGLREDSAQGDRAFAAIVENAARGGRLTAVEVDVSDIPDLVPPLAALFCFADGVTRLTNAGRLRLKESDRLASVTAAINALGGNAAIDGDTLVITGVTRLRGGAVNPHGDHRIAMMTAVLALRADGEVWLANPECVRKSYPDFWRDFNGGA